MGLTDAIHESDRRSGEEEDLVFQRGVNKIWQKKDSAVNFCILPTMPVDEEGNADKEKYLPYRNRDFTFTEWLSPFMQHRGFCKQATIVSPKVTLGDVVDPIELLWEVANKDEEFFDLICKDPNTKKIHKDAYKEAMIRRPEWRVVMNTVDPFDRENPNKVSIGVFSRTAVFKYQYQGFADRWADREKTGKMAGDEGGMWGLLDYLDRLKGRDVLEKIGDPPSFEEIFFEGDITNPQKMAVCQIKRENSPQGGIPSYNMRVTDIERVRSNMEQLRGRYDFGTEVFLVTEMGDLLDKIANMMVPVRPSLLYRAWENRGVEFSEALRRADVTSGQTTIQSGMVDRRGSVDDDEIPMEPATQQKPANRQDPPPEQRAAVPEAASLPETSEPQQPADQGGDDLPPPADTADSSQPAQEERSEEPQREEADIPPPFKGSSEGKARRDRIREALKEGKEDS